MDGERVVATGVSGDAAPMERFVISANGRRIEMVVVSVAWNDEHPVQWTARDYKGYVAAHRVVQ